MIACTSSSRQQRNNAARILATSRAQGLPWFLAALLPRTNRPPTPWSPFANGADGCSLVCTWPLLPAGRSIVTSRGGRRALGRGRALDGLQAAPEELGHRD